MYKILSKVDYSDDVFMQVIEAPAVAAACQAGQFIVLRIHEEGERIPLTIADYDREAGTITIVVQAVGKSTRHLQKLGKGDREGWNANLCRRRCRCGAGLSHSSCFKGSWQQGHLYRCRAKRESTALGRQDAGSQRRNDRNHRRWQ